MAGEKRMEKKGHPVFSVEKASYGLVKSFTGVEIEESKNTQGGRMVENTDQPSSSRWRGIHLARQISVLESVAKSINALNHKYS